MIFAVHKDRAFFLDRGLSGKLFLYAYVGRDIFQLDSTSLKEFSLLNSAYEALELFHNSKTHFSVFDAQKPQLVRKPC